jgi:hypothetical protein
MRWKRTITKFTKKIILQMQDYKCANSISKPSINLSDYECLLWKYRDGKFDLAGYEFDHIDEYCHSRNSDISNIQALCPNCHAVKTRKFLKNKKLYTSTELASGISCTDDSDVSTIKNEIENKNILNEPKKKKRKLSE